MSTFATISSTGSTISTARSTLLTTTNRRHHPNPSSSTIQNPNPNYPYISITGPLPPNSNPRTRSPSRIGIHHSDYIDVNDETLFREILDRIATQHRKPLTRTAKSFLNDFSPFKFTKLTSKASIPTCPICTVDFVASVLVNRLPCKHVFHYECIRPWLHRSNLCPMCRFELPKETVSEPLMRYMVRLGSNLCVEGRGSDRESGFWDAVLRNGVSVKVNPNWFSDDSESTRMGWAGEEGESSEESVLSPVTEEIASAIVDEDGDIVMTNVDEDGDSVMSYD